MSAPLFYNAPYYRAHEGIIGARYPIKNPNDPNSPGLWFAMRDEVLDIARQKSVHYNGKNRDTARADYDFEMVHVQVGDVVIDYHINFEGSRLGWNGEYSDRSKDKPFSLYKYERQNGALIQYHIPKDVFHSTYQWDEVGRFYCKKPYQIKFIDEDLMLDMQDGHVEQLYAGHEVLRQGRSLVVRKPSVMYGSDVRLICTQPLSFYIEEYRQYQQSINNTNQSLATMQEFALMAGGLGHGLSMTVHPREKSINPYGTLRYIYNLAVTVFRTAGMGLSREQQDEFRNHVSDIESRHHYFEVNPGAFTLEG